MIQNRRALQFVCRSKKVLSGQGCPYVDKDISHRKLKEREAIYALDKGQAPPLYTKGESYPWGTMHSSEALDPSGLRCWKSSAVSISPILRRPALLAFWLSVKPCKKRRVTYSEELSMQLLQ